MSNSLYFEEIIASFQANQLPSPSPRRTHLHTLPGRASVVIGMRRSGKTWFLFQKIRELLAQGIPRQNILYLNFEDSRIPDPLASVTEIAIDVFFRMNPSARENGAYFFFDEIQEVSRWERSIRTLLDKETCKIYLTGSSAKLLSKEIATSLRGRAITTKFFPMSFLEFLLAKAVDIPDRPEVSSRVRSRLEHELREYMVRGGLPELISAPETTRLLALQDYLDVIILRDIVERHNVSAVHTLRQLVSQAVSNSGSLFSVSKFYGDLKARGMAVSKETIFDLLDHLEDAFLLHSVSQWDRSERIRQNRPKKIYVSDPGLLQLFHPQKSSQLGQRFETLVFLQHLRNESRVHFYKTTSGYEVDFLIERSGVRELVQAAWNLEDPRTMERETRAIWDAMSELKIEKATIVTETEETTLKNNGKIVEIVPAWKWLLF